MNKTCNEYTKSFFITYLTEEYICYHCNKPGIALFEKQWPERYDNLDFYQVRLEYSYHAPTNRWSDICVVTHESSQKNGNIWNIRNPNIRTERNALKTATNVLAFLQRADNSVLEPNIAIRNTEMLLDFSSPSFKEDLNNIFSTLKKSRLCVETNLPLGALK